MRESFIFHKNLFDPIKDFPQEQLGELFKGICLYQFEETEPKLSPAVGVAFNFIREALIRDNRKFQEKCQKNRENGKLGGRPRKQNKPNGFYQNPEKANGYFENPTKPKKAENDVLSRDNTLIPEKSKDIFGEECYEIIELIMAFCTKHNRTYTGSKEKATKAIKAMHAIDGVEYAEIKEAFERYAAFYTGAQYEPEIFSARALREKWNSLKGFIARLDSKPMKAARPTGVVV